MIILLALLLQLTQGLITHNKTFHFLPHSHDDLGWLYTIEQYFYKASAKQKNIGGVYFILTSVIDALLDDPNRRFVYAEMKFLSMWWR